MQGSFIIHQVFYNLLTLVWQHSSFQLTNSLDNYNRVVVIYCTNYIQAFIAFIGVTMIINAFSYNTNTLQWIDYNQNYAVKLAVLPHANTQRCGITECNQSL